MVELFKKTVYQAFGFNILSDIYFPELKKNELDRPIDIEIIYGEVHKVSDQLPYDFSVSGKDVSFFVPRAAYFSVQKGYKIVVSPFPNVSEDVVRLYILGTCMGILLMQKQILPLHGSVIEIKGKTYAIVGDSGAGKSTLASVFLKKGFKLLSDDVIALTFFDNKTPYVIPSYPQQKLWETSLKKFGMPSSDYTPLFERETKYAIPIHSHFLESPLPLAGIFELEKVDQGSVRIEMVRGVERLKTLNTHTYRNFLIPQLGLLKWHFEQSTKVINAVDLYKLQRPEGSFTAYLLAEIILNTIEGRNIDVDKHTVFK
jgi:hypothetical protein